jgi:lipopolysaccharide transport system permease protein
MATYNPLAFLVTGWTHRRLIVRLSWRKIESRYRGSVLGLLWAVLQPMLMLAIYTFVFSVIFRAKWGAESSSQAEFALFLFSGLILYAIFSECANEAPKLMPDNEIYVKQLIFPTEILSWVSLLTAMFGFSISLVLLGAFYSVILGPLPASVVYLPLVMGPLLLLTLGASWFLASLGVFVKDVSQVVGILTTALLFLSPIFYSPSAIPEPFLPFYYLNPFAGILEMSKGSLFYGAAPDWAALSRLTVGAWFVAWAGYVWFMKTKRSFADVL